jgi:hypothetical protein
MWLHQVLYVRRVYPKDTFCPTRFLSVQCKAHRHPGVVSYISEAVRVAVPALLDGVANEICLVIVAGQNQVTVEKYCLIFSKQSNQINLSSMTDLERQVRDLVLSVHTLEGQTPFPPAIPDLLFKVKMYIPAENKNCSELNQAMTQGSWFCSHDGAEEESGRVDERRRQLFHSQTVDFSMVTLDNTTATKSANAKP